jgi:hypothetical protein
MIAPLPPPDDMMVVQTPWGPMERWRAVALNIGEVSNAIAHRDDQLTEHGMTVPAQQDQPSSMPPGMREETDEPSPGEHIARADEPPAAEEIATGMIEALAATARELVAQVAALEQRISNRRALEARAEAVERSLQS